MGSVMKKNLMALAGVAQWIERRPANQRVAGSIPSQGTCLGCGPAPQWGYVRDNHTLMFLSLLKKKKKIQEYTEKEKSWISDKNFYTLFL